MANPKKRNRSPNYSTPEKCLLWTLITLSKQIIDNKNTDSDTCREKDAAWTKICAEFNAQTSEGILRTKESLKKYYENTKKTMREGNANEKMKLNKTDEEASKPMWSPADDLPLNSTNKRTVPSFDDDTIEVEIISPSANVGNDVVENNDHELIIPSPLEFQSTPTSTTTPSKWKTPKTSFLDVGYQSASRRRTRQATSHLGEEYPNVASMNVEKLKMEMELIKIEIAQCTEMFELEKELKKIEKDNLLLDQSIKALELQLIKKKLAKF